MARTKEKKEEEGKGEVKSAGGAGKEQTNSRAEKRSPAQLHCSHNHSLMDWSATKCRSHQPFGPGFGFSEFHGHLALVLSQDVERSSTYKGRVS